MSEPPVQFDFPILPSALDREDTPDWLNASQPADVQPIEWRQLSGQSEAGPSATCGPSSTSGHGAAAAALPRDGHRDGEGQEIPRDNGDAARDGLDQAGEPIADDSRNGAGHDAPCRRCEEQDEVWVEQVEALQRTIAQLEGAAALRGRDREAEILALALEIARAFVGGVADLTPEVHHALMRAALDAVDADDKVTVRLGSKAFDSLRNAPSVGDGGSTDHLQLVHDPSIDDLGCLVEWADGHVDGRLETRLAQVREALSRAWTEFGSASDPE